MKDVMQSIANFTFKKPVVNKAQRRFSCKIKNHAEIMVLKHIKHY